MIDRRIVKYNLDLKSQNYHYASGCIAIDLYDLKDMKGRIIAEWTVEYAKSHLKRILGQATGLSGGWSIPLVEINKSGFDNEVMVYDFKIESRLYENLRRIYDR